VIVTVLPEPAPLAIVTIPLEEGVRELTTSLILTSVPAPLFKSGFAVGKLTSFDIGTKPPTSSTKSTILASIAAVVATLSSALLQVSPDCISSTVPLP